MTARNEMRNMTINFIMHRLLKYLAQELATIHGQELKSESDLSTGRLRLEHT